MAREYIESEDLLNTGRKKLNRSIDKSYDAEETSVQALKDANTLGNQAINDANKLGNEAKQISTEKGNESIAIAKENEKVAGEANLIAKDTNERMNQIIGGETDSAEVIDSRKPIGLEAAETLGERLNMQFGNNADFRQEEISLTLKMKKEFDERGVNPSWFGAIGDGVNDDTNAIIDAFEYAESNNLDIIFENKQYIYNPNKTIEFSKSINFNNAKFIRNDGVNINKPIVKLVHSQKKIVLTNADITSTINQKTIRIPELSGFGNSYIQIFDDNKKVFKREGVSADPGLGVAKMDQFMVDDDGYLTIPLTFDFDNFTKIIVQPIDDNWSYITGGKHISIVDKDAMHNYFKNGIEIARSNVIVEKLIHTLDNNIVMSARSGFLNIHDCCNVFLNYIGLQPLAFDTHGTYDLNPERVLNLFMRNVTGQNFSNDRWGVMGGNHLKNVSITECNLSRVDSHMGITNLTIKDSVVGRGGIQVVGYGKLIIENNEIYAPDVLKLRPDYGSFWDGPITIKNIIHHRTIDEEMTIISGSFKYDFDYGDDGKTHGCGSSIVIDNVTLDNHFIDTTGANGLSHVIKIKSTKKDEDIIKEKYHMANKILVSNISSINKLNEKDGYVFIADVNLWAFKSRTKAKIYPGGHFDANIDVELSNIDLADFSGIDWRSNLFVYGATNTLGTNADDNYDSDLYRLYWNLNIKNCDKLHANVLGRFVNLHIEDSTIYLCTANQRGCRSWIYLSGSKISPRVSSESSVAFKASFDRWHISSCSFNVCTVEPTGELIDNPFKSVLQDLLAVGTGEGQPIIPRSYMSACSLTSSYSMSKIKPDINKYNFHFGDFLPFRVFHPLIGPTSQRPSSSLYIGLKYYDTTIYKDLIYDGSGWRDSNGNVS
ncbi:hypothetical protein [Vagococcus fluvialis]|uniref:hypothetical protein n=1 Tax=Vagococcus fluvialis TaxID=2738 RepID=UPI00378BFD01